EVGAQVITAADDERRTPVLLLRVRDMPAPSALEEGRDVCKIKRWRFRIGPAMNYSACLSSGRGTSYRRSRGVIETQRCWGRPLLRSQNYCASRSSGAKISISWSPLAHTGCGCSSKRPGTRARMGDGG